MITEGIQLPLPSEDFRGRTVIASKYVTDNDAVVLLLNDSSPYYIVGWIDLRGAGLLEIVARHTNITPAVNEYNNL